MNTRARHFRSFPEFGPVADLISMDEFPEWILHEDDDVLVLDKPGWVVCHPSKNGPLSSLVGACREYTGLETLHLVSRLDRETSGLVIIAKHKKAASSLQTAFQERAVEKVYWAIVAGEWAEPVEVNNFLAKDLESEVAAKVTVRKSNSAKRATTYFEPKVSARGYTLAEIKPITGRKHQIRAHALHLGHPIVGDKIYGPDDTLFLEFIENGWTDRLDGALGMRRQALHAGRLTLRGVEYRAPLAWDMVQFCQEVMGLQDSDFLPS